jgi:hypothetical protein
MIVSRHLATLSMIVSRKRPMLSIRAVDVIEPLQVAVSIARIVNLRPIVISFRIVIMLMTAWLPPLTAFDCLLGCLPPTGLSPQPSHRPFVLLVKRASKQSIKHLGTCFQRFQIDFIRFPNSDSSF